MKSPRRLVGVAEKMATNPFLFALALSLLMVVTVSAAALTVSFFASEKTVVIEGANFTREVVVSGTVMVSMGPGHYEATLDPATGVTANYTVECVKVDSGETVSTSPLGDSGSCQGVLVSYTARVPPGQIQIATVKVVKRWW